MSGPSGPPPRDSGEPPQAFEPPPLPRALTDRYEIVERLGAGGMGVVYKARDRETGATVALKVIHPAIASDPLVVERFKTELLLARQITHKNVCRVYDLNRFDDVVVITMEYVEGESLRDLLVRRGRLPLPEALKIIDQLAAALREAHDQGIVHRDIKPENVLITSGGTTRLMDFGLARTTQSNATTTGVILGTPAYMAPEQAEGERVDARTDIYALGLVLYEMLAGKAPFGGDTPIAIVLKQIREAPVPPGDLEPTIPRAVERAILRALEKDPAKRFQSIDEMQQALTGAASTTMAPRIPRRTVRRPRTVGIAVAVAAVLALAVAVVVYVRRPSPSSDTPFQKFTLENGLRVIISEDRSLPIVSIAVAYDVGSRNERPGQTGYAHLFEHMMFKGSANVGSGEHFQLVTASGGAPQGTANAERTLYYETLPSNQLDLGLFLEADRMRSLAIDRANLDNQIDTVIQERQYAFYNQPYGRTQVAITDVAFDSFAYKHPTVGAVEDLKAATVDALKEFFRLYYAPNNAVVTLVGDVETRDALARMKKYFGDIPAQALPPPPDVDEPAPTGERRRVIEDPFAPTPLLNVAYKTVPAYSPDSDALLMAGAILGHGQSSRLYQKLAKETEVAVNVAGALIEQRAASLLSLAVYVRPGKDAGQIERLIEEEVERLRTVPPTERELERVRTQAARQRALQSHSSLARAIMLGDGELLARRPGLIDARPRAFERVSPADVQRVARTYLTAARRSVILTVPAPASAPSAPPAAAPAAADSAAPLGRIDRKGRAPVSNELIRLALPDPAEIVLDNGLTLLVLEDHRRPTIALQMAIMGAGGVYDPPALPGLAEITAMMLRQGTRARSSRQIAEQLDDLGSTLTVVSTSGSTTTTLSAGGLSDNFADWFALISDVLLNPAFPADELNGLKQRLATGLRQRRASAARLAEDRFKQAVFGDHPAHVPTMTPQAVQAMTSETLRKWHADAYTPDNAILTIVGDITPDRAARLVRDRLSGWPKSGRKEVAPPNAAPVDRTRICLVDRPLSGQTSLAIGNIAIDRRDPDYVPLQVMNQVLGGEVTGRLFLNLREQRGYTYAIVSSLTALKYAGPWTIVSDVRADATGDAIQQIVLEARRIRDERVPAAELDEAKRSLASRFVLSLENPPQLVSYLQQRKLYGFSADYWNTYPAKIMEVSADDVQRVAQAYVNPDALVIVAVGDRRTIEPVLRKLGPVEVYDADGHLIK